MGYMDVPVRYLIFVCAKLGEPIYKLFLAEFGVCI